MMEYGSNTPDDSEERTKMNESEIPRLNTLSPLLSFQISAIVYYQ